MKGERNGTCNRTACNNARAIHFNRVTDRYYCASCARRINEAAAEVGMATICASTSSPMVKMPATVTESCDQCRGQEGRHYCLLHSVTLKNMDTIKCRDFEHRANV